MVSCRRREGLWGQLGGGIIGVLGGETRGKQDSPSRLIMEYCIEKRTNVTRYHELGIVYWTPEMCYLIMESLFDSI